MIKVLSIAGSDPSSGAGMQADLKTFQVLGAYGMAMPAALTVQNSRGVSAVLPVPPSFFKKQLESIFSDIKPDAIKTGMLLNAKNIRSIASLLTKYKIRNIIIDPVVRSSSGRALLEPAAVSSLKKLLFPLALAITPNIPETEALTGMKIKNRAAMDFAAGKLLDMGPSYVLIKGGHSDGPAEDTLYGGKMVFTFSTPRRKGEFHGTGCLLSSAIAVWIARGYPVEKAVEKGKQFVDSMLRTAKTIGKGEAKYFQF